jgi:DNA primase
VTLIQEPPVPGLSESTRAAIKQAVDIVVLIGEYLPLHRAGSTYKALCPFHDDHNPSLNVYPERQSFKCWACGAGGDVFDFVKDYERVDFPEALRMLAERAGVVLDKPTTRPTSEGPSKTELLEVHDWAERLYAEAFGQHPEVQAYVAGRGLTPASVEAFHLGFAPESRDWLIAHAKKRGLSLALLEHAGLVVREPDSTRVRFRGRLIFPIHDLRGRPIGFGGRILPAFEQRMAEAGKSVAKYVNSPETLLFQKRRTLYAADLARASAREAGWVAVVEGYTDVIAAHQVGLANVVGTLGTALGDDHVQALRRLADRVVLVFDGDEAGQTAAERALELFLGHEIDVRVLTLPADRDPCDFLLTEGTQAFLDLVGGSADPLEFTIARAEARFDFGSAEGARRAAEWVLGILNRVPRPNRMGLNLKVAKALDTLSRRLGLPVEDLKRRLHQLQRVRRPPPPGAENLVSTPATAESPVVRTQAIRPSELDPTDRELLEIALNDSSVVSQLASQVPVSLVREAPLRVILQACYDLHFEGEPPTLDRVALRLDDPAVRALALNLDASIEPFPLPEGMQPAPTGDRLAGVLAALSERARQDRIRELKAALNETDQAANPELYRSLHLDYLRLLNQRIGTKPKTAS